jgi:transcriptional regulator of arginine metabolism
MKHSRHDEILKIISEEEILTQEELAARLRDRGYDVAQATISRDIKTLNLVKMAAPDGRLVYSTLMKNGSDMPEKLIPVFKNAFVSCDYAMNLVVIRTLSGMANALASAVDTMQFQGILGTIAGDDTVLIVCKTEGLASDISAVMERMAGEGPAAR